MMTASAVAADVMVAAAMEAADSGNQKRYKSGGAISLCCHRIHAKTATVNVGINGSNEFQVRSAGASCQSYDVSLPTATYCPGVGKESMKSAGYR